MTTREEFLGWLKWGIAHAPSIHYAQTRPIPVSLAKGHLPFTTDCSGAITLFCKWSGLPDPNGLAFDGAGYTGTLFDHLDHIPAMEALPGDLVVFGYGADSTHVVALLEAGADPYVFSHGQELGPLKVKLSVEKQVHAGQPLTYLRLTAPEKFWRFNQGNGLSGPQSLGEVIAQLRRIQQDKTQDREIVVHRYRQAQT